MFLIKLIRKVFKQIKSDMTPTQIAIAVFLGALTGLTPSGLHWIPLFLLALLFNCSMGAYLLTAGLLKPVSLLLGSASFNLGTSLLSGEGGLVQGLVRTVAQSPVLAYLGYERYIVTGGYVIALPLAILLAAAVGFAVSYYRKTLTKRVGDAKWYQKASGFFLFRFVRWVFTGKPKEFGETKKRFILLRPFRAYMVIFIPALILGLVFGTGFYVQFAINGIAAGTVSKATGVQCTFGDVSYSFLGQRLAFTNFQLPDPDDTMKDMVRIGEFEADLGFTDLLSKRFRMEKLALKDLDLQVARKKDGSLNVTDLPAAQPAPDAPPEEKAAWEKYTKWLKKAKDSDWTEMAKKYMKSREEAKEEPTEAEAKEEIVLDYDPDLRWNFERDKPLFRIDALEVTNLALSVTDKVEGKGESDQLPTITSLDATGVEISSRPGWNGTPMKFEGTGKLDGGKAGGIRFSLTMTQDKTDLDVGVDSVPLLELKPLYEKSLPVKVENGRVTVGTKGSVEKSIIDTKAELKIEGLKIAARPDEPTILGLDEQTSGYAIQGINAYGEKLPVVVGVGVTGPLSDPSVEGKVPFLEIAKKGLEMLGRKELQVYIDKINGEVDALKKAGTEKVDAAKAAAADAAKDAAGKALKGDVKGALDGLKDGKGDLKDVTDVKDLKDKADPDKAKDTLKDAQDKLKDINPFK